MSLRYVISMNIQNDKWDGAYICKVMAKVDVGGAVSSRTFDGCGTTKLQASEAIDNAFHWAHELVKP